MSDLRLPGPVVYVPTAPVDPEDLTGGMPWTAMVDVLATLDIPAAIAAAAAARHVLTRYRGTESFALPEDLWVEDGALPCCTGARATTAHRTRFPHLAHLYLPLIAARVNDVMARRLVAGAPPADPNEVLAEVVAHAESLAHDVIDVLDEIAAQATNPRDSNLLYLVPFLALNVPAHRAQAYQRERTPWPIALTFEAYGPPTAQDYPALARVALPAPPVTAPPPRAIGRHLRLVRP